MLSAKRSVGVAPEVNLRNPLSTGDEACKWGSQLWLWNPGQTSPEVQNRDISGPIKRTYVLQKLKKMFKVSSTIHAETFKNRNFTLYKAHTTCTWSRSRHLVGAAQGKWNLRGCLWQPSFTEAGLGSMTLVAPLTSLHGLTWIEIGQCRKTLQYTGIVKEQAIHTQLLWGKFQ